MSYDHYFKIKMVPDHSYSFIFHESFKQITGYEFESESTKSWYDCVEDMVKLSKRYPLTCFTVDAYPEEPNGQIWRAHFLNGQSQEIDAVLTYEPCKLWSE